MRILLLEDEFTLRISMVEFLEDLGFTVDDFESGDDALDALFKKTYDLILLDVKVPGINGFELLRTAREYGKNLPAIFITSLTDVDALAKGYKSGCCDYIKKPFDLIELQLRVEQALKSSCLKTQDNFIDLPNNYVYDTKNFVLLHNEEEITLTKTEKRILELLIQNRGNVVTPEQFQEFVWGEAVDPANIRVQINKLRKKLSAELISNVRGLGYRIDL
ncbi:response regulator transcription factor [Hydrogenimonas thermophila]|uniref:DNA-binding response regulator, OmpR family, contains REC and winged-helix (WHTH) domain n=1 Tax=Hydrogenimonas thermophila TaxID=223786 RepID=A0A1I5PNE9_9BACT|nr:response regulator transcription factor [Hydrogenimonas thermophila]SFP35310.1 DNA-binding response regulator, OmpR family, contains REC and winged-helix (wHTH) domain [Hydrogenimonas thermophila]